MFQAGDLVLCVYSLGFLRKDTIYKVARYGPYEKYGNDDFEFVMIQDEYGNESGFVPSRFKLFRTAAENKADVETKANRQDKYIEEAQF